MLVMATLSHSLMVWLINLFIIQTLPNFISLLSLRTKRANALVEGVSTRESDGLWDNYVYEKACEAPLKAVPHMRRPLTNEKFIYLQLIYHTVCLMTDTFLHPFVYLSKPVVEHQTFGNWKHLDRRLRR